VDRDAHARAARRRQALDVLAFEREREAMLEEQLEDTAAQLDGEGLDANAYAQMSPEDVQLVRAAFGEGPPDGDDEDGSSPVERDGDAAESEEELTRLQDEIASSRRLQAALEHYLDALAGKPAERR
jgi:hypothetical protein